MLTCTTVVRMRRIASQCGSAAGLANAPKHTLCECSGMSVLRLEVWYRAETAQCSVGFLSTYPALHLPCLAGRQVTVSESRSSLRSWMRSVPRQSR